jgi:hypothetical protein
MQKIVVGVDPDAEKHGVAVYIDGVLTELAMLYGLDIARKFDRINPMGSSDIVFHIEDVMANQFVYARNTQHNKSAQSKVAMHIGRCQQAQVELMRILVAYELPYKLHKPQKGNWAKDKELFEKITGWTKQSNEDTRSAAYFGYLGLKNANT